MPIAVRMFQELGLFGDTAQDIACPFLFLAILIFSFQSKLL